jgi:hypothetical protein
MNSTTAELSLLPGATQAAHLLEDLCGPCWVSSLLMPPLFPLCQYVGVSNCLHLDLPKVKEAQLLVLLPSLPACCPEITDKGLARKGHPCRGPAHLPPMLAQALW